jgi:hypothetical protein
MPGRPRGRPNSALHKTKAGIQIARERGERRGNDDPREVRAAGAGAENISPARSLADAGSYAPHLLEISRGASYRLYRRETARFRIHSDAY